MEKKSTDTPSPSKGYGMIGFDPESKFFTITAQENSGLNCTQRTPGFTSNQAEWKGEMFVQGKKIAYREIFVKKGDTELFITNETALNNGKWLKATETTCKKL